MTLCTSCGTENATGAKFCVRCGAGLATSAAAPPANPSGTPEPGSWLNADEPTSSATPPPPYANAPSDRPSTGGYAPPHQPPSYPTYTPPQNLNQQQQSFYQQQAGGSQPMHPAVPALVSFFFPGLGLLFVPNKAGLGIGIFIAYMVLAIITIMLVIGICLVPIANVLLAIHSWDEAAKNSNGQFQPILFK